MTNWSNLDIEHMRRAIELASKGEGFVAPNPMVGAVVVHNNIIIGEGYHEYYGGSHAEVNAINSVKDKSLLFNTDLVETLEFDNLIRQVLKVLIISLMFS